MSRIVVVGMGQLGALFADALAARGHEVVCVRRGEPHDMARAPSLVLVTVGEDDLAGALDVLPPAWRDRVALVQNELAPDAWRAHGVERPTIASVFFEKKKDRPAKVVLPTPVAGPHAGLLVDALTHAGLAAEVAREDAIPSVLFEKNLYILVSNLAGLACPPGTTTAQLLDAQGPLTRDVFREVAAVERARLGVPITDDDAWRALERAFRADPDHVASGRSAKARLARTLSRAESRALEVPVLRALAAR
jgi:ketopantoate reductase